MREGVVAKAKAKTKGKTPKAKKQVDGDDTPSGTPSKGNHKAFLKPAWQPGQSGNPSGRPRGARTLLGEHFIADLKSAWERKGISALDEMIEKDPVAFVREVGRLVPQQFGLDEETSGFLDVMKALGAASNSKDE